MKKQAMKKRQMSTRTKQGIVVDKSAAVEGRPDEAMPPWLENFRKQEAMWADLRRREAEYKARDRDAWRASLELVSPGGKETKTIASIGTLAVQAMCGAHMEGATPLDFSRALLVQTANELRLLETRAAALPGHACEYFIAIVKRLDASVKILDRFIDAHKAVA